MSNIVKTTFELYKKQRSYDENGVDYYSGAEQPVEEIREFLGKFEGGKIDLTLNNENGIAKLVLNNPSHRNAITGRMMVELEEAVDELQKWKYGKGIIVYGAEGNFCSGGDLKFVKKICNPDDGFKMATFMQVDVPEFFQNRDPASPELTQSFNTIYMFTLPELSNDGYRISFCGLLDPDTEKFSATDMSTRSLMHFDIRLQEECCLGDIYVMDLALFSISHLKQYSVSFIKKSVMCQMDAMPFRVKGIHFLNSSLIVAGFIKIFKLFLNEKQRNRIFVHYDDHKTLHKYISKDILPKEFQGQGPSIVDLNNSWRDKLMSYREWFLQQCNN